MDLLKTIPTHMDFDGQGRAEKYYRFIITLFGVVGLLWGYIIQQFSQTVYILGAGFVLAALVSGLSATLTDKLDFEEGDDDQHFVSCRLRLQPKCVPQDKELLLNGSQSSKLWELQHKMCLGGVFPKFFIYVTIPPWPMYRRKSLQWQKPRPDSDFHGESTGKSKKKK